MSSFRDIRVVVWPDTGWRVQWWIDGVDPNHTIEIERSQSPEGPWSKAGEVSATQASFEDSDVPYRSYWTLFFYRLKIKEEGVTSEPVGTMRQADRQTREIIRQYELSLKGTNVYSGQHVAEMACFKRTIDGTTCPNCIDPNSGLRIQDRCDTCEGTGYVEGWSNPIKFSARFLNGPSKSVQMTQFNEQEEDTRRLFTAAYPIIEPHDVLVEKENGRRWRVIDVRSSEPNGIIVSQSLTVNRVDREFVENSLMYPGES